METNKILNELTKKPETFKEKLEDIWFDISVYYPGRIKDGWIALKRFFRNLKKFWSILWKDDDFDYGYLEELILQKLTWMAKYFRTARIVKHEEKTYLQINLAIRLAKIAFDREDNLYEENRYLYPGYVNIKNRKRYTKISEEFFTGEHRNYGADNLRRLKARHIFWKYIEMHSQTWWD